MSLSFADIDSQHVELLPARTVMSLFATQATGGGSNITISNNSFCGLGIGSVGVGVGVLGLGIGNVSPGFACTGTIPSIPPITIPGL
jgi:hypothetical protein